MLASRDARHSRTNLGPRAGASILALIAVLGSASAALGKDASVVISDFSFTPAEVKVVAGQPVTWQNSSATEHTVTADDGSFASDPLGLNDQFGNVFSAPGTYAYHCTIHPRMTGTVVVTAAAPTATPKGTPPPTPPAGTLPPDFNTPVPIPTAVPTVGATTAPTAIATATLDAAATATPVGPLTSSPTATPPPGEAVSEGSGPSTSLLGLAALLIAAGAVAAVLVRRRRSPGP